MSKKPVSIQSRRKKIAGEETVGVTKPRRKRERKQEPITGCVTIEYYGEDDPRMKLWDDLIASFMDPIIEQYLSERRQVA